MHIALAERAFDKFPRIEEKPLLHDLARLSFSLLRAFRVGFHCNLDFGNWTLLNVREALPHPLHRMLCGNRKNVKKQPHLEVVTDWNSFRLSIPTRIGELVCIYMLTRHPLSVSYTHASNDLSVYAEEILQLLIYTILFVQTRPS